MTQKVLVIGGTVGIGLALARLHGKRGDDVCVVGRGKDDVEMAAADLKARFGVEAVGVPFDLEKLEDIPAFAKTVEKTFGLPDRIYLNAGFMTDVPDFKASAAEMTRLFTVNVVAQMQVLDAFLPGLMARGSGEVVGLSSVAAVRGKGNNPVYGASKAALKTYLEGMDNALAQMGVNVTIALPGYVDTGMVYGLEGTFHVQSAPYVAKRIAQAADKGCATVYSTPVWWAIGLIIRLLPSFIYRRKPFITRAEMLES